MPKRTRFANTRSGFDYLIVGAGFAGSVLAERLAAGLDKRVLLIDRRPHIAGNAYDHYNDAGLLIHRYGPHIFHTNSTQVVDYLSRFTKWRPYEHKVLAHVDEQLVPIPINLTTLERLYGLKLTPEDAEAFLKSKAEPVAEIRTSEDVVVNSVGRELYEKFFRGYTRKQWGLDPSELDKSVTSRVPTRTNTDDRYFGDSFQNMPLHGYTRMFENMLDHPNIKVMLNTDFEEVRNEVQYDKLIYSGPIDEYFDFRFGKLPYRSLQFRHETVDQENFQPVAVVNYPSESVPYTRITEYKHLTGQVNPRTSLTYEYPAADGDPYYPVPRPENAELYRKYQALADATPDVTFVGRLGTYRYYNMDQVVGQALALFNRIAEVREDRHRSGAGRSRHGADERHRPCRSRAGRRRLSAENIGMHRPELFDSFFMGGFECSTHRRHDGRRLDLIDSDRPRQVLRRRLPHNDRARHPDGSRWGALAPHRDRRPASSTGPASCRCCMPAGQPGSSRSGTSATMAGRTISTSGSRTSSIASPTSRRRWPRWCGMRRRRSRSTRRSTKSPTGHGPVAIWRGSIRWRAGAARS